MSTTHPDAFHFDRCADSYWEASAAPLGIPVPPLAGDHACDVAIIGAGFTGLSAALELREHYGMDVRVLEAAQPGWGASGRNGGFSCVGSHKLSYGAMIKTYGLDASRQFHGAMKEAVSLVRENCRRYGIDALINEGGEVSLAHLPSRVAELADEQAFMARTFGEHMTLLSSGDLAERGMANAEFPAGLHSETGFSIHPLAYVRGLARAASAAGATLHGQSRVTGWEQTARGHVLRTANGRLTARHVIVATNGYTPEDVSTHHAGRLMPVLSNIIVTRPLSEDERREQGWTSRMMAFDTRKLLHYFRLLPDGRFLFGGRGGLDASDAGAAPMRHHMEKTLARMFPVFGRAEITHFWRGFACLAYDLVPYAGPLDVNRTVWTAIAYHGNGVAMASWSGRKLAHLVAGRPDRADLPAVMTRRLAKFPVPALRKLYLKAAYQVYAIRDAR